MVTGENYSVSAKGVYMDYENKIYLQLMKVTTKYLAHKNG